MSYFIHIPVINEARLPDKIVNEPFDGEFDNWCQERLDRVGDNHNPYTVKEYIKDVKFHLYKDIEWTDYDNSEWIARWNYHGASMSIYDLYYLIGTWDESDDAREDTYAVSDDDVRRPLKRRRKD